MESTIGKKVQSLHQDHVMQSWSKQGLPAIPVEKADGIYFWDYDGKKYADMSSLLVCSNLGHNNRTIIEAIKEQADKMCYMAPAYATAPKSELAELIISLSEDNMQRVFFTSGGAESNENAIKMARMFTGRNKIFSRYRSYHGATLGAANASGDWRRFAAESAGATGFVKFMDPYMYHDGFEDGEDAKATAYYLRLLEEQLHYEGAHNVAAIIMETITGANGILIPPDGYMEGVRALCDKYGIMLICDEVMAGFGRTGKMFAFQNYGIKPDLVTFAKGVSNGYVQLGGVVVSKEISKFFEENALLCGLTYSGHTLACAAGIATVNYYLDHNILDNVDRMGVILADFLDKMVEKHPCVGQARHIGLFTALEIVKDKRTREPITPYGQPSAIMPSIMSMLKSRGFSTFGRENNINICPPLTITEEELMTYLPILDEVLTWVDHTYLAGPNK